MPQTDEWGNGTQSAGECKQTGIALQLVTELVQGAQAFLGLAQELGIGLENLETHGIVYMTDGNPCRTELLAQKDILVTIISEPFIERVLQHNGTIHQ